MFSKKLSGKELGELQKRNSLVNEYVLIAQALELQKRVWLKGVTDKMGLDSTKSYEVDPKSGKLTELATPIINGPQTN
jgi:hypothetical protein